jgi:hypothetical protein
MLTGYIAGPVLVGLFDVPLSVVCGGGTETGDVAGVLSFAGKTVFRPFARNIPPPTRLVLTLSLASFASAKEAGGLGVMVDEGETVLRFLEGSRVLLVMGVMSSSFTSGFDNAIGIMDSCLVSVVGFVSASVARPFVV